MPFSISTWYVTAVGRVAPVVLTGIIVVLTASNVSAEDECRTEPVSESPTSA